MKKLGVVFLLPFLLLSGCASNSNSISIDTSAELVTSMSDNDEDEWENFDASNIEYTEYDDEDFIESYEDYVYNEMVDEFEDTDYYVQNVEAVYVSQEYIDEYEYNTKSNIFFGYTLEELRDEFDGGRYVFTLGDNNKTEVIPFNDNDDVYKTVIKNVAVGSGVILLCVTVASVTAPVSSLAAVSAIFSFGAKAGIAAGAAGGAASAVISGIETAIKTDGNLEESLKAAAVNGSETFKCAAIIGAATAMAAETVGLYGASLNGLTMNEAATIQKASKYPLKVIKQLQNMDQYNILKEAGLTNKVVNGKDALIRNIDLTQVDEFGRTNLERMKQGLAALDPTGEAYQLHHIGQEQSSTLAILTKAEHMLNGNNKIWHTWEGASKVNHGTIWTTEREAFWKSIASILSGGGI